MPICIMCGKRKPTIAFGWVRCRKCGSWYCPDCLKKLRIRRGLKDKRICSRCYSEI